MRASIGVVLVLAGCAADSAQSWVKPDANDADARAALARCRTLSAEQPVSPKMAGLPMAGDSDAAQLGAGRASLEDMANYRRSVEACMAAGGWTRR